MKLTRSSADTARGPADWFTGVVYIDGIRNPDDQSAVGCAHVRFTPEPAPRGTTTPRARPSTSPTASGTSPAPSTDGTSQPQEIRPGDVVYIEPGEEHWHGATAGRFMAHVAVLGAAGEVVTWLEHVTDEDYAAQGGGDRTHA